MFNLKEAVSRDFFGIFFLHYGPIWVPDKQSKMVLLEKKFREDIHKKRDSAQCDTVPSRTPRRITLHRVRKLKCPKIQNCLTLCGVGLREVWNCAKSDSAQYHTAWSFAGNNFVFAGLSLPSMRIKKLNYMCTIATKAQHFLLKF